MYLFDSIRATEQVIVLESSRGGRVRRFLLLALLSLVRVRTMSRYLKWFTQPLYTDRLPSTLLAPSSVTAWEEDNGEILGLREQLIVNLLAL
ncbi:hypothetical protein BDW60DRAFT_83092 [Aspergillus nidulans var. acristatus]